MKQFYQFFWSMNCQWCFFAPKIVSGETPGLKPYAIWLWRRVLSSEKRRLLVSQFWPNFSRHCSPNQLNRNLDFGVSFFEYHLSSDVLPCGFWLNVFTLFHALTSFICVSVVYLCYSYSYSICLFCVWCIGLSCVWRSWCSWCSCSLDSGSLQRGELTLHVSQGGVPHLLWFALKTEEFQVSTALWYLGSLDVSCSLLKWAVQRHCTFFKSANHFFSSLCCPVKPWKQIKNPGQTASGVIERLTWTMHCYKRCRTRDIEGQMQQGETRNAQL